MYTIVDPLAHSSLVALNKAMDKTNTADEKIVLLSEFWASVKKNPLIDEQADGTCNLTFVYRGDADTKTLNFGSSIYDPSMSEFAQMKNIDGTDIWQLTIDGVPKDARISYLYLKNGEPTPDPLNSYKIDGFTGPSNDQYIAELPDASKQPNVGDLDLRKRLQSDRNKLETEHRLILEPINFSESRTLRNTEAYMSNENLDKLHPGTLKTDMADVFKDEQLRGVTKLVFREWSQQGEQRDCWIHLPPNYDPSHQYKVLVHLDGKETIESMKLPVIMEKAMSAKENPLEPTISIYVDVANRNIEYGCTNDAELFAKYLATELMPKLREKYPGMSPSPEDTTIAGFSMGGHAAAQVATQHPEVFGNVISQSGSFWMGAQHDGVTFGSENEGLLKKLQGNGFPSDAAKNLCFYLNGGSLETAGFHLTPTGHVTGYGICGLVKMTTDNPEKLTPEDLNSRLNNHVGCIQYQDKVFFFDKTTLRLLPPDQSQSLNSIMNSLNNDELNVRNVSDPDFEIITSATGYARFNNANLHFAEFLKNNGVACEFETYSGDHCFAEWQNLLVEGLIKTRELQRIANPSVEKTQYANTEVMHEFAPDFKKRLFDKKLETLNDKIIALNHDPVINEHEYKAVIDSLTALTFPELEKTHGVIASLIVAKNISPHLYQALEKDISALIKNEPPTGYADYVKSINITHEDARNDIDTSTKDINSTSLKND